MTSSTSPEMLHVPVTEDDARPAAGVGDRVSDAFRHFAARCDIKSGLPTRLAVGIAAGLGGYLLSRLMQWGTGEATIILSLIPVVLAAYRCGLAAGLAGTIVAYALAIAFIYPPSGLPVFEDGHQATRIAIGSFVFIAMTVLGDQFRRAQLRTQELLLASEELRAGGAASEASWRLLAGTMPGLVSQRDAEGRVTFLNDRYAEYTGMASEQLREDMLHVVHPDDQGAMARTYGVLYATGQPAHGEWRIQSRRGEYRWHAAYLSPQLDGSGRMVGAVGVAVDVHDQRMAETAVEAQRALFDTIISASPVGIGVWDREFRCVAINDTLARMSGIAREDTIGRSPAEYMPDQWREYQEYFEAALRGEATEGLEFDATTRQGESFAVVASYFPVRSGHQVTGVALVATDVTAQHSARQQLERSEERYRQLSEAMPAMVSLIDPNGKSYYWNRAFFEYTGLSIEQALDWWREGLVIHEDVNTISEAWTSQVTRGLQAEAEVRVRDKAGQFRWHNVRAVPFGNPAQWLLVATDIHDRKLGDERRAVLARETAEARAILDGIVHQAPLGIAFVDLDGRIVHVNDTVADFDGIPMQEHVGKHVAELMPRFWERMEPVFNRVVSGEESVVEFEHSGRSLAVPNERRTWNMRWYRVEDSAGDAFGVSILVEDITERKQAEAGARLLEEATQQLATSLDYEQNLTRVAELAVEHLADMCVIDVFPSEDRVFRAASAASDDAVLGKVADIHLRDWRVNGAEDTFGSTLGAGREVFVPEVSDEWLTRHAPAEPELLAARSVDPASLLAIPLRVKDKVIGAFTLAMGPSQRRFTTRDVALARELATRLAFAVENSRLFGEAQRALEALQQSDEWLRAANAAKDEFLSMVSHELRTPITTILGNASIIQRHGHTLSAEDLTSAVEDIHEDAGRLNAIIDNLLSLARLERGQDVETEPLVLRRIVRRVVDSHSGEHRDREYLIEFPPETILVEGNAVYMEQVLRNLISNAERYSPAGSIVEIIATRQDSALEVSVMDRGVGIDPGEAESLFEPFFRSTRTTGMKGIGVGLAVCKRLVEFQGGSLRAEPREGGGAVFTVTLPISNVDDFD